MDFRKLVNDDGFLCCKKNLIKKACEKSNAQNNEGEAYNPPPNAPLKKAIFFDRDTNIAT
jgi:hypothetical protein